MLARILLLMALLGAAHAAPPVSAQVTAPEAFQQAADEEQIDALHHVLDSNELETPFGIVELPEAGSWMVGPIDMTPTKYVVFLWIIAAITLAIFIPAGLAAKKAKQESPHGGHNAVEAIVLFFRDAVVMPNVGHGGEKYVPFVVGLFTFILIGNLLALVPYGAAATANINVTAGLAILSFIVIEAAGMKALGPAGYMRTIVYWNMDMPIAARIPMAVIMTPIELLGKFSKPFALAIRLMANMASGKIMIYVVLGLIFMFGSYVIAVGPVVMVIALTFLKLFVALLQAYIFALLTSVFIGLIIHAH